MSLTAAKALSYEETGSKNINGKRASVSFAEKLGTHSLLWILIKRHKVALLIPGWTLVLLNWAFPQWTEIVKALLTR